MSETQTATKATIVGAFLADLEITYGGGGAYAFHCDGTEYELVVDESFYADGDPSRHEVRATVWTDDEDDEPQQVTVVRFLVDVIA